MKTHYHYLPAQPGFQVLPIFREEALEEGAAVKLALQQPEPVAAWGLAPQCGVDSDEDGDMTCHPVGVVNGLCDFEQQPGARLKFLLIYPDGRCSFTDRGRVYVSKQEALEAFVADTLETEHRMAQAAA